MQSRSSILLCGPLIAGADGQRGGGGGAARGPDRGLRPARHHGGEPRGALLRHRVAQRVLAQPGPRHVHAALLGGVLPDTGAEQALISDQRQQYFRIFRARIISSRRVSGDDINRIVYDSLSENIFPHCSFLYPVHP